MRILRRTSAAALGAITLAAGLTAAPAQAAPAAGSASDSSPAAVEPVAVTLITGDQVLVREKGAPRVIPGPGREDMPIQTENIDGEITVLPSDAADLIAQGKVDRRLFEVSGLIDAGYDDTHRSDIPLIVDRARGAGLAAADNTKTLSDIGVTTLTVDKGEQTAWQSLVDGDATGVQKLWLDGKREPFLDQTVGAIGAPGAWEKGFDGSGIKVAVLDTGVDETHPDLNGQVAEQKNFSSVETSDDEIGHGTHVAATIASKDPKFRGVAPGATILDGKVCDNRTCSDSAILAGMQWAVERGAKVVNISLGSTDTPEVDPLEEAINTLSRDHGTLFVVAAGNAGKNDIMTTIGTPSTADAALSVAATTLPGITADFSSRGPRSGDGAVKPEVSAPGVGVTAAASTTAFPGQGRISMNGTSMATPHVAGSAAILAQVHPEWTGAQLKSALMASANPQPGAGTFDQGSGRVDVTRAIAQTVTTSPASVSFGNDPFPHDDDLPKTQEVTYRNGGDTALTLSVSLATLGPDGREAPTGMFTVDKSSVTVPAGGTATVNVTGDTRHGTLDGAFSAQLLARATGVQVVTPIGVTREADTQNLTMNFTGPDGAAPRSVQVIATNLDSRRTFLFSTIGTSVSPRLPAGDYVVSASIRAADTTDRAFYNVYAPKVDLTKPTTLEFDATKTKSASITPPDAKAVPARGDTIVHFARRGWEYFGGSSHTSLANIKAAVIGEPLAPGELTSAAMQTSVAADESRYGLGYILDDRLYAGFEKVVGADEVATVSHRVGNPPTEKMSANYWLTLEQGDFSVDMPNIMIKGPQPNKVIVEHVNAEAEWIGEVHYRGKGEHRIIKPARSFHAGREYDVPLGIGVFGPTLRKTSATRTGDTIKGYLPLLADAHGGYATAYPIEGHTELFRDGVSVYRKEKASELSATTVTGGDAEYRLVTELNQSVRPTSSKVTAEWTFDSATTSTDEPTTLPLSVARFQPVLDFDNAAPAGRLMKIPFSIQSAPTSKAGTVRHPVLEVSFDDGETWRRIPATAGGWTVFRNPTDGFVSLRASGADSRGNTFRQTVIRAYAVK